MAKAIFSTAGRPYGVQRVCELWDYPTPGSTPPWRQNARAPCRRPRRRGPKLVITDAALLAAIKRHPETSPWTGEGHRKLWARLRVLDGIRVFRKRLLHVKRENTHEGSHDRRIITDAPNVLWAIDATQVTTVEHGKVWIFGVAEHWNAEFMGWHISQRGTRFEAIQALSMAVRQQYSKLVTTCGRQLR